MISEDEHLVWNFLYLQTSIIHSIFPEKFGISKIELQFEIASCIQPMTQGELKLVEIWVVPFENDDLDPYPCLSLKATEKNFYSVPFLTLERVNVIWKNPINFLTATV